MSERITLTPSDVLQLRRWMDHARELMENPTERNLDAAWEEITAAHDLLLETEVPA